jgi:prepilin-type processing-associated H-X9-DG protein
VAPTVATTWVRHVGKGLKQGKGSHRGNLQQERARLPPLLDPASIANLNQRTALGKQTDANNEWIDNYGFASYHSDQGGANFAFCDAHVQFINNTINMTTTYRYLATAQGDESIVDLE